MSLKKWWPLILLGIAVVIALVVDSINNKDSELMLSSSENNFAYVLTDSEGNPTHVLFIDENGESSKTNMYRLDGLSNYKQNRIKKYIRDVDPVSVQVAKNS